MSTHVVVFNPGDTPVVVEDGRTVEGRGWASVRRRADEVRQAVDAGHLLVVSKPEGNGALDERAEKAFQEADEANAPKQEQKRAGDSDKSDKSKGA